MKISQKIIAKIAVVLTVAGISLTAQAQSKINVTISNLETATPQSHASLMAANPVSKNAASDVVRSQVAMLQSSAMEVASAMSAERLEKGTIRVAVKASPKTLALIEEETLNVKVSFEARPVGGILNVQVTMTPSFRGVGVAARPTISRSAARAVDELNDATVQEIVRELTLELQSDLSLENTRALTVTE